MTVNSKPFSYVLIQLTKLDKDNTTTGHINIFCSGSKAQITHCMIRVRSHYDIDVFLNKLGPGILNAYPLAEFCLFNIFRKHSWRNCHGHELLEQEFTCVWNMHLHINSNCYYHENWMGRAGQVTGKMGNISNRVDLVDSWSESLSVPKF